MQMAGHVLAALLVPLHDEGLNREDLFADRSDVLNSGLLPHLTEGYGVKIGLAIRVSAGPGPGIINVVIGHQDLSALFIYHPGGCCHMAELVVTKKWGFCCSQEFQDVLLIPFLLLIVWAILSQLLQQLFHRLRPPYLS